MVSRGAALDDRPALVSSGKRRLGGLGQFVRFHSEHLWESGQFDSRMASRTRVRTGHGGCPKSSSEVLALRTAIAPYLACPPACYVEFRLRACAAAIRRAPS